MTTDWLGRLAQNEQEIASFQNVFIKCHKYLQL